LLREPHGPHLHVIHKVADEEYAGHEKGGDHDSAVLLDALAADKDVSPDEKNRSRSVKDGIYRGKDRCHVVAFLESGGATDSLLEFCPGKQISQARLEKIRLGFIRGGRSLPTFGHQ